MTMNPELRLFLVEYSRSVHVGIAVYSCIFDM